MSMTLLIVVLSLSMSMVSAGEWPMYQHDARHSGVSDSKIPEKVTIAWRYSVS